MKQSLLPRKLFIFCMDWHFDRDQVNVYSYFKIQPGPVAKNAIARPPAGNWIRDLGSLDQSSTNWATKAVAVSLGASSVYT